MDMDKKKTFKYRHNCEEKLAECKEQIKVLWEGERGGKSLKFLPKKEEILYNILNRKKSM